MKENIGQPEALQLSLLPEIGQLTAVDLVFKMRHLELSAKPVFAPFTKTRTETIGSTAPFST